MMPGSADLADYEADLAEEITQILDRTAKPLLVREILAHSDIADGIASLAVPLRRLREQGAVKVIERPGNDRRYVLADEAAAPASSEAPKPETHTPREPAATGTKPAEARRQTAPSTPPAQGKAPAGEGGEGERPRKERTGHRARIRALLVERGQPMTAVEISEALGLPRKAVHSHLSNMKWQGGLATQREKAGLSRWFVPDAETGAEEAATQAGGRPEAAVQVEPDAMGRAIRQSVLDAMSCGVWLTAREIAAKCGLSIAPAVRHLQELDRAGLIYVRLQQDGTPNYYARADGRQGLTPRIDYTDLAEPPPASVPAAQPPIPLRASDDPRPDRPRYSLDSDGHLYITAGDEMIHLRPADSQRLLDFMHDIAPALKAAVAAGEGASS